MDPTIFETIYAEDRWHGGSGPGSDPEFCRPLVAWFRRYVATHAIRSVVDLGCGDMRWMPEALAGLDVRYTGLDAVASLIERHCQQRWPAGGWTFRAVDVSSCPAADIPAADMYWAKDVLQHWPTDAIVNFLDRFFAARPDAHVVVANCAGQVGQRTLDDRYHFAPLSMDMEPLARHRPEPLMSWGGKQVVRLRPA